MTAITPGGQKVARCYSHPPPVRPVRQSAEKKEITSSSEKILLLDINKCVWLLFFSMTFLQLCLK